MPSQWSKSYTLFYFRRNEPLKNCVLACKNFKICAKTRNNDYFNLQIFLTSGKKSRRLRNYLFGPTKAVLRNKRILSSKIVISFISNNSILLG